MGFGHMHGKHKGHKRALDNNVLQKRADCPNNNPYITPAMNAIVDSLQPLIITWNPVCYTDEPTLIIMLSAPDEEEPRLHAYTNIPSSSGNYTAEIKPRWWNSKPSQKLQITILTDETSLFQPQFVAGPVFTATYAPPADGSIPDAADTTKTGDTVTTVGAVSTSNQGITPGGKAAAVLVPLIFIGLAIAAYIKWKRTKQQQKSKKWTEKVDQRMSTISVDWKSVSAAGANAAIRNSMAVGMRGSRTSSAFAFGAIRPSSTFAVEDKDSAMSEKTPGVRTTTGVGLRNPGAARGGVNSTSERVSRVSFAPDTRVSRVSFADSRPSGESRRTRAYHSAYVPPVPALPDRQDEDAASSDNGSGAMSPRQTEGAMALTPEAIRARIHNAREKEDARKDSMDEVMPALSMMRTGNDPTSPDDFLFHHTDAAPAPPPPAYIHPHHGSTASPLQSPVVNTMPMDPVPASVMSPDEMLRAYAERKKSMGPMSPIRTESPVLPVVGVAGSVMSPDEMLRAYAERKKNGGGHATTTSAGGSGMRVLYNASTGQVAQPATTTTTGEYEGGAYAVESTYSTGSAAYDYDSSMDYNAAYNDAYAAVGLGYPSPMPTGSTGTHATTMSLGGTTPVSPKNASNPFLPSGPVEATPYPFGHHPNASIGVGSYGGAQYTIGDDDDEGVSGGMAGRGAYRAK
ncbi:hypothetical protein CVT24_002645 [Panaeolus cyanescens]|uniref:Uncharacterized protein n=1 Tax=Panaeolus cyanescens TaxID=181874 RepID=A0A409YY62_9AGAR|nr:hypothetical protein CVT24_002645 [Panaeolus cyanescens]